MSPEVAAFGGRNVSYDTAREGSFDFVSADTGTFGWDGGSRPENAGHSATPFKEVIGAPTGRTPGSRRGSRGAP